MMTLPSRLSLLFAVGLSLGAAAPTSPRALAAAESGQWAVSRSATGEGAQSVCLSDPSTLAQWEHRGGRCTRVVISDAGAKAVIHYTCADGGFGRSDITLVTPRSLKIATQGISSDGPFNYALFARRIGQCPPR